MANLINQKILRLTNKNKEKEAPAFITEDVIEVKRAKLIYYRWISRLMAFLATISLLYGICATLSILKLAPSIIIDPQIFVSFSDSESYVKRERIEWWMDSREKMMINFMKQYVEYRNTYIKDAREMENRWLWGGLVSYLSTYNVYKSFEKEFPAVKSELDEKGASRSVEILSVERTGGENSNTWKIEFKTYDFTYQKGIINRKKDTFPIIKERYWTANVRGYVDPRRITSYRRLLNPLGFVIYSYYQSEIKV